MKYYFAVICPFLILNVFALDLQVKKNEFTVQTKRLSATVRDGNIIELRDIQQGIFWCESNLADYGIPSGLGVLSDIPNLRKTHIPWGEPTLNQHLSLDTPLLNYYKPTEQSKMSVRKEGDKILAIWQGLSNDIKTLENAELRIEFGEAKDGALTIRTAGINPKKNVFGIPLPLINIPNHVKFIFANFGGMEYDGFGTPGLMPFGGAPFVEAPLMILQQEGGNSLGLWMEDPSIRPFYVFFRRSGKSISLAMENLALMPFENNVDFFSPELKLDVFKGDWKTAATPYRDWYREYFKNELAIRDNVKWVDQIKAIFDIYMNVPDDNTLSSMAENYPASKVMFQVWNARAPSFDRELPDWTPREGYIDGVSRLHKYGFKVMAYVNTYCANYQSPVWQRDKLSEFFLTRKNSIGYYKGSSVTDISAAVNEKLIGTVDYSASGEDQFKDIVPGRLLYGDPLSKQWREYHAQMMKEWNSITGTDANYEDTAGCVGDFGNGFVDGLSAGEGSIAAMHKLQETQPLVPFSSEYGPSGIAFATKFALNYAGHWGYDDFKRYRISHQHPVNSFLFGYRQWISGMMTDSPLLAHACAATSDATGGLGFAVSLYTSSAETVAKDWSFRRHLLERAKVFIEHDLLPFFPVEDFSEDVRCIYQGKNGLYSYIDSKGYQCLLDPQGNALYGRSFGINKIETELYIPSWPLQNEHTVFGLDPQKNYALFPGSLNPPEARIRITELPDKVFAKQYIETSDAVVLELAALPGGPSKISFTLLHDKKLSDFYANDRKVNPAKIEGSLPLRLVAFTASLDSSLYGERVAPTGKVVARRRGIEFFRQNNGARHFPVKVLSEDDALAIYFQNLQTKYPWHGHDGTLLSVLLNGKEVAFFDSLIPNPAKETDPDAAKFKPDDLVRRWVIPIGKHVGNDILLTLKTDLKGNINWDNQLVSVPMLIKSKEQQASLKVLDDSFRVVKNLYREGRWFGAKLAETEDWKTLTDKNPLVSALNMKIDTTKVYRLSGKFKVPVKEKGWLCFGLVCYDEKGQVILPAQVMQIEGTLTKLAAPAKEGDMTLVLENNQAWKSLPLHYVAINAKENLKDLPNTELLHIDKVEGKIVTLKTALKKNYPSGIVVRQHKAGDTHTYTAAAYKNVAEDEWSEFAGEISGELWGSLDRSCFRPGTVACAVFIQTTQNNLMFKDIAFEEIEYNLIDK